MNTTIFIGQLPQEIQKKIRKSVITFFKKEGCYSLENVENCMDDRFCNLYCEEFKRQYNKFKKEIEANEKSNGNNWSYTSN